MTRDLADTQLISKYNKEIRYLLCPIDHFGKDAWVVPLINLKVFETAQRENKKKIWVDQGSGFYNGPFKKWLKGNGTEMYTTYIEETSSVAEKI